MTHHDQTHSWNFDTLLVHGGLQHRPKSAGGIPTIPPIYASTTYLHSNVEALDQAFSGTTPEGDGAFVYGRQGNPSEYALEDALTRAENGVGSVVFSSGMAAIHASLLAAGLAPGAKIVASKDLYGPSIGLLQKLFIPNGVEVVLADLCCPAAVDLIRQEQPDVIYVETISNPLVKVMDLDAIAAVAHEVEAVTIVDSTFATPYLVRPIEHGFDLVVHSATKYIGGHGDSFAGAVISAKNALLDQTRHYSILLGAMLSPFDAHLMLRGLRTLPLRMERHCSNAAQVAHFLQEHPAVAQVYYPGLPDHPQHDVASRLLEHEQYGGLVAFELKDASREAVFRFMDHLQLCLPATSLGDVFTLVSYPPISTHRTLTKAELQNLGITDGCVRISVGIEHIDDIIQDLDQALKQA